ncbi:SUKH-3 domain-containing protein [Actinoplanes sp. NPDC049802]|uniref:SUKH-3 domain-containing protein n=1 Tax=Actinoplanes sp. NPDC049802 TaxID=3154742 RepID=UPI0033E92360
MAITRADAEDLAQKWVDDVCPGAEPVLYEFARGWVLSARTGSGHGPPSMILDRDTGELVIGGTLSPSNLAAWYMRGFQPAPGPAGPRRYPATMSRLTIAGRSRAALSLRSDTDRPLHPAVAAFFETMPAHHRERGAERGSEAVVFSELFYAEEAGRSAAGLPLMGLSELRELVCGARLETYRIREDGDPASGSRLRPGLPVLLFLDHLGLDPDTAAPGQEGHVPRIVPRPRLVIGTGAPSSWGFSDDVAEVLRGAGWSAQRRVTADSGYGVRHPIFPTASRALDEFCGLYVTQDGAGVAVRRQMFAIDPSLAAETVETLEAFGQILDTALFPLGVEGDGTAFLTIDERGRVFALDHGGEWFLGADMGAALTTLITGTMPPRVRDDGTW